MGVCPLPDGRGSMRRCTLGCFRIFILVRNAQQPACLPRSAYDIIDPAYGKGFKNVSPAPGTPEDRCQRRRNLVGRLRPP